MADPRVWIGILADKIHLSLSFSLAMLVLEETQYLSGERRVLAGILCAMAVLFLTGRVSALERAVVLTTVQWYSQQISVLWRGTQEPLGNLLLTAPMLALAGACTCTWAAQLFAVRVVGDERVVSQIVSMTMLFVTTDVLNGLSKALPLPLLACSGLAYLALGAWTVQKGGDWRQHMHLYLENIACRAVITMGLFRVVGGSGIEAILVLVMAGTWFWSTTHTRLEACAAYTQCRSMYSYNLARQLQAVTQTPSAGTNLALAVGVVTLLSLRLPSTAAEKWWLADCLLVVAALQWSTFLTLRVGLQTVEQGCVYVAVLCVLHKVADTQHHHNIAHNEAPHNLPQH